jgi:hypothetical protein
MQMQSDYQIGILAAYKDLLIQKAPTPDYDLFFPSIPVALEKINAYANDFQNILNEIETNIEYETDEFINTFRTLNEGDLCGYLRDVNSTGFNATRCYSIGEGVLAKGLSQAVPYYYSSVSAQYFLLLKIGENFNPQWVADSTYLDDFVYILVAVFKAIEVSHDGYTLDSMAITIVASSLVLSASIYLFFYLFWKISMGSVQNRWLRARQVLIMMPLHLIRNNEKILNYMKMTIED